MRKILYSLFSIIFTLLFISCDEVVLPKPAAYLSLEYPKKAYQKLSLKRPYSFDVLKTTTLVDEDFDWLKIKYPNLKASIDITYRPVENNLIELLTEAEKLVFKHVVKAEEIIQEDFTNGEQRVFGSIYEITGNAASQLQFHVTDSTDHFIKGSLYFYAKPNYDSILPAVNYIKEDVLRLVETLQWKKSPS
jgi:gliding motility-associated lipoprotein GldD